MHTHAQPDTRVRIVLSNTSSSFRDVKVGGQIYTVYANGNLTVKAPAGTEIYTASSSLHHHTGDVLASLTPAMNDTTINLN